MESLRIELQNEKSVRVPKMQEKLFQKHINPKPSQNNFLLVVNPEILLTVTG